MPCPKNQSREIILCSQKKEEEALRSMLKKYKKERKSTAFSIRPSLSVKKTPKKIKIKKLTKKLKIKKKKPTPKKSTPKTKSTQKKCKKRCPHGSRCNNKTGRCKKTKQGNKRQKKTKKVTSAKKKATVIQNTTPSLNKEIKLMTNPSVKTTEKQLGQYSPSINRAIMSLRQLSPHPDIFDCTKNREIKVQTKSGAKCVGWKTKKAQQTMLDNLLSKKKIVASHIIAPKQSLSNCWFNAFFMTFFISDLGRKFNRSLRESMITGNIIRRNKPSTRIAKELQWPFFLLNKYIEASLRGTDDPTRFAELMDTNVLIRQIYNATKKLGHKGAAKFAIAKTRQPSNPLTFYTAIMNYLYQAGENPIWKREFRDEKWHSYIKKSLEQAANQEGEVPHIVYMKYGDHFARNHDRSPPSFTIKYKYKGKTTVAKYKLDSAILRDINQVHFSAYLTINGKEYGFDGESFSRIEPFQWKKKLYQDTQWRFADQHNTYFNFEKGYQILIYYRVQ